MTKEQLAALRDFVDHVEADNKKEIDVAHAHAKYEDSRRGLK